MNDHRNEKLLRDMLKDASDRFREELFEASLTELRRRRQKARRSFVPWAIAAGLAAGAGLLFSSLSHRTRDKESVRVAAVPGTNPAPNYQPIEIVTTAPLEMALVDNHKYTTLVVENSGAHPPLELLGDAELLALFPDKAAGLVSNSQGVVRLVFFDPKDQASIGHF